MSDRLILSDLTADYDQFMFQFNDYLKTKPVWKGVLTTMTSQTLLGLISTVGVHDQATLIRAREDSFAETAQADDAIRAIAQMQGLRMTRKSPAELSIILNSPYPITLEPYSQFTIAGTMYFNRHQIEITQANTDFEFILNQGQVVTYSVTGNGTDYQSFISEEDQFVVSDFDTRVQVNGVLLNRTSGGLWNYRNQPAFSDLTMADGRLLIQFGNTMFGTVPQVNDQVFIQYVITEGDSSNNASLIDKNVSVTGFSSIQGSVITNPTGGSDEQPTVVYKNVASGSLGTYESGVTKNQYVTTVNTYPGIADAITQAQREINPMDLKWMNVIRVSALTTSPWTAQQKNDFIEDMERRTMYASRFYWQDPIAMPRDLVIQVYAFNTSILSQVKQRSEQAVQNLFAPRTGLLQTNFYNSDLVTAIKKANNGQVSYVLIIDPTYPMTVTPPSGIKAEYTVLPGGGTLTPNVYAYSISVEDEFEEGPPNAWVFPQIVSTGSGVRLRWRTTPQAIRYRVWGRLSTEGLGLLATFNATTDQYMEFIDDGSSTPSGVLPNTLSSAAIRYNQLRSLRVDVFYADRQQKLDDTLRA